MTRLLFAGPVPDATRDLASAAVQAGFIVFRCGIDEAVPSVRIDAIDVVILDPKADGGAGAATARRMRRLGCVAAIVLITDGDPPVESVVTWLGDADHCLIGVLEPDEILAHVAAVERRRHGWASARIEIGEVAVDTSSRLAEVRGVEVALTATEYALLHLLMTRAGRCVSKGAILDHLYGGEDDEPTEKIVDVLICKVRHKLARAGAPRDFVETVWGRGYLVRRVRAEALAA